MCGLVGILALGELDNEQEAIRQEAMIVFTTELLKATVPRGDKATGISTLFTDGNFIGLKKGVSAKEFVVEWGGKQNDYEGYMDIWRKYKKPAKMVIGHCRKPSASGFATPWKNENNHPIRVGDVVGAHNGTIKNKDIILKKLNVKADGEVDSEAIIRLLHHYSENGKRPWTIDMLKEIAARIEGAFTVLAYGANNPYQMPFFREDRPLIICLIKNLNLLVVASERPFYKDIFGRWNEMRSIYGRKEWPMIYQADLDFSTITNGRCGIMDLRHTVKEMEETKANKQKVIVEDFFEDVVIPVGNKKWAKEIVVKSSIAKTPVTVVENNKKLVDKPASTTEVNPPTPNKGVVGGNKPVSKEKLMGRVFCKAFNEFRDASWADTDEISCVEINSSNGEVTKVSDDKIIRSGAVENGIGLKKTDVHKPPIDNPAQIENAGNKKEEDIKQVIPPEDTIEVDMTVDPKAIEAATKACDAMTKFEDDDEVAEALEASVDSVKQLPLFSLANRMKRTFFKFGYSVGWMDKAKEGGSNKEVVVEGKRDLKYRKNFRGMKNILTIFSKAQNSLFPNNYTTKKAIRKSFEEGNSVDTVTLDNIFSAGDLRDNPQLEKLVSGIKEHNSNNNT